MSTVSDITFISNNHLFQASIPEIKIISFLQQFNLGIRDTHSKCYTKYFHQITTPLATNFSSIFTATDAQNPPARGNIHIQARKSTKKACPAHTIKIFHRKNAATKAKKSRSPRDIPTPSLTFFHTRAPRSVRTAVS